jgi:flagellar biosynthesis protein FliP
VRRLLPGMLLSLLPVIASGAEIVLPGMQIDLAPAAGKDGQLALALQVLIGMTVLALLPSLLIVCTSFIRIILVLSMLRHALGMQQTPPNSVLIALALFLTLFSMMPVVERINETAWKPYETKQIGADQALKLGAVPLKEFMIRQTREEDLALMLEIAKKPMPKSLDEVTLPTLIPAFMLSELTTAFKIGFIVFVPFLLVDLVVSSLLMSLGMLMMPPMMISLPIKVLIFVLIDGWGLIVRSLMASFH